LKSIAKQRERKTAVIDEGNAAGHGQFHLGATSLAGPNFAPRADSIRPFSHS